MKKKNTRFYAAWVLPLALLTLPNCNFGGPAVANRLMVYCDINLSLQRSCATPVDLKLGVDFREAAIALAQGKVGTSGLDRSPQALAQCSNEPQAVGFAGPFPQGTEVCIDESLIGPGREFEDANALCVSRCLGLIHAPFPVPPVLRQFCEERAHPSTNMPLQPDARFLGCTDAGNPDLAFVDPRVEPEVVEWQRAVGVTPVGADLERTTDCTSNPCRGFDAGAASVQDMHRGDGYVEFSVTELTTNRIAGLTTGFGFADGNVDFSGVSYGLNFFRDSCIYIFERGLVQPAPPPRHPECVLPDNAFGHYAPGDRFRVAFHDNLNDTATIDYAKLPGPCAPGTDCPAPPFFTSGTPSPFPLHVDAAFEDKDGAIRNVLVVFIH